MEAVATVMNDDIAAPQNDSELREEQEFQKAVLTHKDSLLKYAMNLTKNKERAEDMVQDVMVRAFEKREQFILGTNLKSWLMTIMKNHFMGFMRSSYHKRMTDDPEGFHTAALKSADNPEQQLIAKQGIKLIDGLTEVKKKMLMEVADGDSYEEVAAANNVPEGTVKSTVSRARDELEAMNNGAGISINSDIEKEVEVDLGNKITRYRKVVPFERLGLAISHVAEKAPYFMMIDPKKLLIEEAYQRSLTKKSRLFIRKVISNWDWTKFKAPNCAFDGTNIFIIDGQHTSIAAASHPSIDEIPILVMPIDSVVRRAQAFVSLNRNRVAMSPMDIFHAAANTANSPEAKLKIVAEKIGGRFLKYIPIKANWKPNVLTAPREWIRIIKRRGDISVEKVMKVVIDSKCVAPTQYLIRAVDLLLHSGTNIQPYMVLAALQALPEIDREGAAYALNNNLSRADAIITILYNDMRKREGLE